MSMQQMLFSTTPVVSIPLGLIGTITAGAVYNAATFELVIIGMSRDGIGGTLFWGNIIPVNSIITAINYIPVGGLFSFTIATTAPISSIELDGRILYVGAVSVLFSPVSFFTFHSSGGYQFLTHRWVANPNFLDGGVYPVVLA